MSLMDAYIVIPNLIDYVANFHLPQFIFKRTKL